MDQKKKKIAILHNWLWNMRGAERCLEVLLEIYPNADLFALFGDTTSGEISKKIASHDTTYSWLNSIPGIRKIYRHTFPLWPMATESIDLSGYDLVIISTSSTLHGALSPISAKSVAYMYSPMRYIWDQKDLYAEKMNFLERTLFLISSHFVRIWDLNAIRRPDKLITISNFSKDRMEKYYGDVVDGVIYPPVNVDRIRKYFNKDISKKDQVVMVSGFQENKGAREAVEYAKESNKQLIMIGEGPLKKDLVKSSMGHRNIQFTGWVDELRKFEIIQESEAVLLLGVEDFGMVPVEAAVLGVPVLAFNKGGAKESVGEGISGVFIDYLDSKSIESGLKEISGKNWDRDQMSKFAMRFDVEKFKRSFVKKVSEIYN